MRHEIIFAVIVAIIFRICSAALAEEINQTSISKGLCGAESHLAEGAIGDDLTKRQSRFFCDSMVITIFGQNQFPKHVMVQFVETKAIHGRQIGYAGQMDDKTTMEVANVYLEEGRASKASDGACKFFYSADRLSSVVCGAKIDDGGRRTVPIVVFDVASTDSASKFVTGPGMPSNVATPSTRRPPKIDPRAPDIDWDPNKAVQKGKLDYAISETAVCIRDSSKIALRLGERDREKLGSSVVSLCKAQIALLFVAAKAVNMTLDAQQRLVLSLINGGLDQVLRSGR